MPLGTPTAPTPAVGASGTFCTTAPFNPAANSLLFAHLCIRRNSTPGTMTPIDSSGGMLSWQQMTTNLYDAGSGVRLRQSVYVAATVAGLSDIQITNQATTGGQIAMQVLQITGTISIPVNKQVSAVSLTGSPSVTLPNAPLLNSDLLAFYVMGTSSAPLVPTPPSGFSTIENGWDAAAQLQMQSCHDPAPASQTNAWTGAGSFVSFGSNIEIRSPLLARARAIWTG